MINVKTENGRTSVRLDGGFKELCADSACVIRGMYQAFLNESEDVGEKFKKFITKNFENGTIFDENMDTKVFQASGKEDIRKLLEHLKDLLGDFDED